MQEYPNLDHVITDVVYYFTPEYWSYSLSQLRPLTLVYVNLVEYPTIPGIYHYFHDEGHVVIKPDGTL